MSNNIVYHLFCYNDGVQRFMRTYEKITKSGLIDQVDHIYVNCVGQTAGVLEQLQPFTKVNARTGTNDKNESETINWLRELAGVDLAGNTLYLHSKGAWRASLDYANFECIQAWIDWMEYFLIEQYENCLESLQTHDTCGCQIDLSRGRRGIHPQRSTHYSGNFWWARNDYLVTLQACPNHRFYPEWYFLHEGNGRHQELARAPCTKGAELYDVFLPRSEYVS